MPMVFKKLKQALYNQPVLVLFDPTKSREVYTDPSSIELSAVMLQHYYSRRYNAAEAHYPSHELEDLAIVATHERLPVYPLGAPFIVRTGSKMQHLVVRQLGPRSAEKVLQLNSTPKINNWVYSIQLQDESLRRSSNIINGKITTDEATISFV